MAESRKISPAEAGDFEDVAPAAPQAPRKVAPSELADFEDVQAAAPVEETSFGKRMLKHIASGANAVGTLATDALDAATGNYYSKVRNVGANLLSAAGHAIAPNHIDEGAGSRAAASEADFNAAHPILENTARGVGYLAPTSEASMLARSSEAALGLAGKALPPLVGRVLTSAPVRGAVTGALSSGGTAGAEATQEGATPTEALREAGEAAKVGGLVGAGVGAVGHVAEKASAPSALRDKAIDAAKKRATRDIGQDIVSAEGPKARATAAQQVAEVNDRIFKMTQEDPSLRKVWSGSAEESLPKIKKIKDAIAGPLDSLYRDMDERTGGGIRLGDVVDGFRSQAAEAGKMAKGIPDAERLNHVADLMLKAYGEPKVEYNPDQLVKGGGDLDGMKTKDAIAILERSGNMEAKAEADHLRELATKQSDVDLDKRIPTAQFREEVTHLGTTAQKAMGSIEGSVKHDALDKLYRAGKQIIDGHIDASGAAPENIEQLRDINNKYFLLSRAENAIESRGTKEANRPLHTLMRSPHAALGAGGLPLMAYAAANPHQIPHLLTGYAAAHAIPEVAKAVNWKVANLPKTGTPGATEAIRNAKPPETAPSAGYQRAVRHLADLARKTPTEQAFIAGARAYISPTDARRIYQAAHPQGKRDEIAQAAP